MIRFAHTLLLMMAGTLLLSACQQETDTTPATEAATAPAAHTAMEEGLTATIEEAIETSPWKAKLADPQRPDRDRDAGRKPVEVIEFLGIAPGATVMDMFTAGGYYSEVLAAAVGPEGTVYAQNIDFLLKMRDGANDKALTARLANDRLPNVVRLDAEMDALGIEPGSLDAITFALNFHDVYNGRGVPAAVGALQLMGSLLKPDGVIGLIDHAGNPDGDNENLHRIDPALVRETVAAAGLTIAAESDALANPDDDRTGGVFAEGMRGNTDRLLFRITR